MHPTQYTCTSDTLIYLLYSELYYRSRMLFKSSSRNDSSIINLLNRDNGSYGEPQGARLLPTRLHQYMK